MAETVQSFTNQLDTHLQGVNSSLDTKESNGIQNPDSEKVFIKAEKNFKLFVAQIPKSFTAEDISSVFEPAGKVLHVSILKDNATKTPKGCCFVTMENKDAADKAIELLHEKKLFSPCKKAIQVKYADEELERLETKLFVCLMPNDITEKEISSVFSPFGTVKEVNILKNAPNKKTRSAFVKFDTREQAEAAIDKLHGKLKMEGSSYALVVKFAETDREKEKKAQKNSTPPTPQLQFNPLSYGGLPFNPGYYDPAAASGFGFGQASGVSYPIQTSLPTHSYPSSALQAGMNYLQSAATDYSVSDLHKSQYAVPSASSLVDSVKSTFGPRVQGPPGANLFIYNLPPEFKDNDLFTAFSSFGNILNANVFIDQATGKSKNFGFLSYDAPEAASIAIDVMNGFNLGGKKLKVQLKQDASLRKPY